MEFQNRASKFKDRLHWLKHSWHLEVYLAKSFSTRSLTTDCIHKYHTRSPWFGVKFHGKIWQKFVILLRWLWVGQQSAERVYCKPLQAESYCVCRRLHLQPVSLIDIESTRYCWLLLTSCKQNVLPSTNWWDVSLQCQIDSIRLAGLGRLIVKARRLSGVFVQFIGQCDIIFNNSSANYHDSTVWSTVKDCKAYPCEAWSAFESQINEAK